MPEEVTQAPGVQAPQEQAAPENPPSEPEQNQLLNQQNIWDSGASEEKKPTEQAVEQPDTSAQLTQYIESQNFVGNVPTEAVNTLLSEHNPEPFMQSLNGMMQNMFRTSLTDMSRMINGSMQNFEQKIMAQVNQQLAKNKSVDSLNTELDFASNPNLAPIAQSVKAKALQMGKNDAEANAFVKQFFAETAQMVNGELGENNPFQAPGRGGYNSTGPQQPEVNWAEIIGAP